MILTIEGIGIVYWKEAKFFKYMTTDLKILIGFMILTIEGMV